MTEREKAVYQIGLTWLAFRAADTELGNSHNSVKVAARDRAGDEYLAALAHLRSLDGSEKL